MAQAFTLKVDTSDLARAEADLRAAAAGLPGQVRRSLAQSAEALRAAVAGAAGFSTRIPAAVKATTQLGGRVMSVSVYVDTSQAPEAGPLNNRGRGGKFQHPVFGHDVLVSQAAHPFFDPPIRANLARIDKNMTAAMDATVTKAGFR